MLGVSDGIADQVFQEPLQHGASFLVDRAGNAFDATTAGQAADCRLWKERQVSCGLQTNVNCLSNNGKVKITIPL